MPAFRENFGLNRWEPGRPGRRLWPERFRGGGCGRNVTGADCTCSGKILGRGARGATRDNWKIELEERSQWDCLDVKK